MELSWFDAPTDDPRILLQSHTASSAYTEAVTLAWPRSFLANAVVLVFGGEPACPRTVVTPELVLQLVGTFSAPERPDPIDPISAAP